MPECIDNDFERGKVLTAALTLSSSSWATAATIGHVDALNVFSFYSKRRLWILWAFNSLKRTTVSSVSGNR